MGKRIGAIRETQRVALKGMREAFKRPAYHVSLN
ncbi:MAG: hypothetical protein FJ320_07680 [SAR202 cluster bacterium]|nr:hypothetical protein [SAR202 cluster bacterium]